MRMLLLLSCLSLVVGCAARPPSSSALDTMLVVDRVGWMTSAGNGQQLVFTFATADPSARAEPPLLLTPNQHSNAIEPAVRDNPRGVRCRVTGTVTRSIGVSRLSLEKTVVLPEAARGGGAAPEPDGSGSGGIGGEARQVPAP